MKARGGMRFGSERTTNKYEGFQRACEGSMDSLHISEESWGRNQLEHEGMEVAPTPTPVSKPRPTSLGLLYSSSQLVRRLRNIQAQGALRLPSATLSSRPTGRGCATASLSLRLDTRSLLVCRTLIRGARIQRQSNQT